MLDKAHAAARMPPLMFSMRQNLVVGVLMAAAVTCGAASTNAPVASTNAPAKPKDYRAMLAKVRVKQQERGGLEEVQKAISTFQMRAGRLPAELGELVERGMLPDLPVAPAGMRFAYDRITGNVRLTPIASGGGKTNLPGSANLVTPH